MKKINAKVFLSIGLLSLSTFSSCVKTNQEMNRTTVGNVKRSYNRNQKKILIGAGLLATAAISGFGLLYANMPSVPYTTEDNCINFTNRSVSNLSTTNFNNLTDLYNHPYIGTELPYRSLRSDVYTINEISSIISMDRTLETENVKPESSCANIDYVKCLISNNKNLNKQDQDKEGKTILMCAAMTGAIDVMNLLIDHHVDLDIQDKKGKTALMHTAIHNSTDSASLLIKHKTSINIKDYTGGRTALIHAARYNSVDVGNLLIKNHANIEIKDTFTGLTALMHAVIQNNKNFVQLLINSNADLNSKNTFTDQTALMYTIAPTYERTDIATLLINNRVDLNLKDKDKKTALIYAAEQNKLYILNLLVENNASLNEIDNKGRTALIHATLQGNINVVKRLLQENRIDKDIKDEYGKSAFDYALELNGKYTDMYSFFSSI